MNCFITDRKLDESCVSDLQCVSVDSTLKDTSGICQCKKGHLYHWKTDTCGPVEELQSFFTELSFESVDGWISG